MSGTRILVVEDNAANATLVSYLLQKKGYEVEVAGDAARALELLPDLQPQLVLMDLQLPGMDGLELTRRLKADPATRDILVLALTAYAMKGDEERARQAGCDGYMSKPIDTRKLPEIVAAMLSRASKP